MNVRIALLISTALCTAAHAEWYQVKSVTSYNQITAVKPNEPANELKIRINNLANIVDMPMGRSRVLLAGQSATQMAKNALEGQLVWVENLKEDSGIFVADVFLSYEQVVHSFSAQRLVGGQTVAPEIRSAIQEIYKRMLRTLDSTPIIDNAALYPDAEKKVLEKKQPFSYESCYSDDYLKGIFTYEALAWFKEQGQYLSLDVQKLFVTWLAQYQTAQPQRAKEMERRIRDMTLRYELYKDFLFAE